MTEAISSSPLLSSMTDQLAEFTSRCAYRLLQTISVSTTWNDHDYWEENTPVPGDDYVVTMSHPSADGLYNDNKNNHHGSHSAPGGREAYEFVAFLLWYLFLVTCCVVPTACAYRRRRRAEARIAEQQAAVHRMERQNIFILSSFRHCQQSNERVREQRSNKLTESLKATTMTVEDSDLVTITDDDDEAIAIGSRVIVVDDNDGDTDNNNNRVPAALSIEYDIEAADPENAQALRLPQSAPHGARKMPAACAICLCPYEMGDDVTWSPKEACLHGFHTECLIPWLAKTNEPKCPCCRQDFCDAIPLSQLTEARTRGGALIEPAMGGLFAAAAGLNMHGFTMMDMDNENVIGNQGFVIPHFLRALENGNWNPTGDNNFEMSTIHNDTPRQTEETQTYAANHDAATLHDTATSESSPPPPAEATATTATDDRTPTETIEEPESIVHVIYGGAEDVVVEENNGPGNSNEFFA